ncbi:MAG: Mrp/NBP35 family ATP-binding protein [Muribaculaceae bacterium]|nr:Mrp/NBP35 family ATP-binding protein [Muribaculaceae bacterium]
MTTLYPNLILDVLKTVRYPGNGKDLVENNMVADDIRIDGNKVSFSLIFEKPTDPFIRSVVRSAEAALQQAIGPELDIKGNIGVQTLKPVKTEPENPLPGVKNIIGISSGKGGVGKSTVAANLAVALAAKGYKVGLLDADIFGPSMPKMFGVEDEALYMINREGKDWIEPVEKYGVKMLSIGFVVDKESAVLWRGSMASNALKQLITDAWWGDLDYFLIDMPPGTSDIHLTLVQTLPITGVVVVSTPQQVALADARKGISMFRGDKVNVPILGIVENMAYFTPAPHPEEKYYIFGREGARHLAEELGVDFLAQIPLVGDICDDSDSGLPTSLKTEVTELRGGDGTMTPEVEAFKMLAENVVKAVDKRNRDLPPTHKVEVGKK